MPMTKADANSYIYELTEDDVNGEYQCSLPDDVKCVECPPTLGVVPQVDVDRARCTRFSRAQRQMVYKTQTALEELAAKLRELSAKVEGLSATKDHADIDLRGAAGDEVLILDGAARSKRAAGSGEYLY